MASTSADWQPSAIDRREEELDAAGHLGWHYMKQSRQVTDKDIPAIELQMNSLSSPESRRAYLMSFRDTAPYHAYCYAHPEDTLEDEQDAGATSAKAEFCYTGKWVAPWCSESRERRFELDGQGQRVAVTARNRALFCAWTRQWWDGGAPDIEEDLLESVGPGGEILRLEPAPPSAVHTWEESSRMQQKERKAWDKAREPESDLLAAVRLVFRRLRARFRASSARAVGVEAAVGLETDGVAPVKRVDSGRGSMRSFRDKLRGR